jgi:3-phosphoshikimate 1-carboxyvinyltransferase
MPTTGWSWPGALVGLVTPGVVVEDPDTVGKTMPDFVQLWSAMVAGERPAPA